MLVENNIKASLLETLKNMVMTKYIYYNVICDTFETEIKELRLHLKNDDLSFYKRVYTLFSKFGDPHLAYRLSPLLITDFFPVGVFFLDKKCYISSNVSDDSPEIKPGLEVIEINNIKVSDIIQNALINNKYTSLTAVYNYIIYTEIIISNKSLKLTILDGNKRIIGREYEKKHIKMNMINTIKNNSSLNSNFIYYAERKKIGEYGYIKIPNFISLKSVDSIMECFSDLKDCTKLIIDLRMNMGGKIKVAEALASLFIKKPTLLFYEQNRTIDNNYAELSIPEARYIYPKLPDKLNIQGIIVLQNEYTSSCAEYIFLNALKKNYDCITYGKKTAGFSNEATKTTFIDNSQLEVTTKKYIDQDGNEFNRHGYAPDVELTENFMNYCNPEKDTWISAILENR